MMMKKYLPNSLFGRALLIVVLPTILVQAVTAYIFYERHWDNVTRHMANSLAGEIAFLTFQVSNMDAPQREALSWVFEQTTGIYSRFEPQASLAPQQHQLPREYRDFRGILAQHIDHPFRVRQAANDEIEVQVQFPDGIMILTTTQKRIDSGTTYIFMMWMLGAAVVFSLIAIIFLRNQVRPIRQLAKAADSFGKGRDMPDFKPHGAREVRQAARAFMVMRERILKQIRWRTEMLAGISHDLRTPLTRMKLQLAMLGNTPEVEELQNDVTQMEQMIAEYLDFAKGSSGEEPEDIEVCEFLQKLRADYERQGRDISVTCVQPIVVHLRRQAFGRMLTNLIDNALRYGGERCDVTAKPVAGKLEMTVTDNGQGIPEAKREEVFQAFTRLDTARNLNRGGVGLGLTIARDVARSHGGNITLSDAPQGGLQVTVRLPL